MKRAKVVPAYKKRRIEIKRQMVEFRWMAGRSKGLARLRQASLATPLEDLDPRVAAILRASDGSAPLPPTISGVLQLYSDLAEVLRRPL